MFSLTCKRNVFAALALLVGMQTCSPSPALAKDEWTMLTDAGIALKQSGNLKDAEVKLQSAYRMSKTFSDQDVRKATAADNLAEILEAEGRLTSAEHHYREALEVRDRVYGKGTPLTARAQFNLGRVKASGGDYIKAKPFLTQALKHRETSAGKLDQPLAEILFTLGKMESHSGRSKQAENYLTRSLKIHEALGRHQRTAESWSQLALVNLAQGRLLQADNHATTALIYTNRNISGDKIAEAAALDTVARVKLALKQVTQAQDISGQAARLRREATGSVSDSSADSLLTGGMVKLKQGKLADAEKCFTQAIQIYSTTRASSDKNVQDAYFGRAFARLKQGNLVIARTDFDQAMALLELKVDKNDPIVTAYTNLYAYHIGDDKDFVDAMKQKADLNLTGEVGELDPFGALLSSALPEVKLKTTMQKKDADLLLKALGIIFVTICVIVFVILSPNTFSALDMSVIKLPDEEEWKSCSARLKKSNRQTANPKSVPNTNLGDSPSARTTVTDLKIVNSSDLGWKDRLKDLEQLRNTSDRSSRSSAPKQSSPPISNPTRIEHDWHPLD